MPTEPTDLGLLLTLQAAIPDDPRCATYQEDTMCFWCEREERWKYADDDPDETMGAYAINHDDDCAWVAAREALGLSIDLPAEVSG